MLEKMKNRYAYLRLLSLAVLLLAAAACVEPIQHPVVDGQDNYTISFRIRTQDDALRTKAGEGGPISGTDVLVNKMFMYCFDANGRYLGRFEATDLTSAFESPYSGQSEPDENTQPAGTFQGEIPPATSRIHFVANADCPVGNDMIGLTEEQVMHSPEFVYRTKDDAISYWGYLRRDSPSEMAALFDGTATTTVLMIRDRAWIESGTYDHNVFEDNISWVVYNGLNRGYIATRGIPEGESQMDTDNPYQELLYTNVVAGQTVTFTTSTVVTPYPETAGRFTTTEDNMVPFDKNKTGYKPMYVFDDLCPVNNTARVVKIIVKATYKTGTQSTRYFPICVTHGYSSEPVSIMRGHRYQLDLQVLPEASGYATFADAAASRTFANGALVDVPDQVIEVSDGQFDMRVNYPMVYPLSKETFNTTAILLQSNPASNKLVVPFSIGKQASGVQDKTFNFSESQWLELETDIPEAHTSDAIAWGAGINASQEAAITGTLNTSVTLPLQEVGSTLKESSYNLKGYYVAPVSSSVDQEVHHILMRNIDVFTIDRFLIQEAYTSSSENHNSAGNLVLINTGVGTYQLKFKLPGGTSNTGDHDKYPELLYPLQVKLATTTLQPTGISIAGVPQTNAVFGVQIRTTEPGVAPAMLDAQNNANQWNYQEEENYWNFWYTYPIVSVPRDGSGNEIIGPEIVIDLKDMRNSSSFSTIPNNVGLYLYIEFFGAANAVSYTQAYEPVTGVTVSRTDATNSNVSRNGTAQLTATVSPNNATYKNVKWSSSNPARATVDEKGKVTTYNNTGNVTITATTVDQSKTGSIQLTVY